MIEYFESGERWQEIHYSNGKIEGVYKVFTKTGEELNGGLVRGGKKVGKWKYHYTEDWEEAYTKEDAAYYRIIDFGNGDLKEWPTTDYFISGKKQFEGFLAGESPDVLSGKCKYYFENGKISQEIEYNTKGKPLSLRIFDEAGTLLQEGTAVNPNAPVTMNWKEYYPNGNIKSKGVLNPTTGIKIGTWMYYDEDGNSTQTLENQH